MVYYFLAILADAGITATFSLNKLYRTRVPYGVNGIARKIFVGAVLTFVLFWAIGGFRLRANGFVLGMAAAMVAVSVAGEAVSFTAYGKGQMSLFTVFQMQGGMLLPFLYGVLYGNRVTPARVIGICLMAVALVLAARPPKGMPRMSRGFVALCCAIFFINGAISILSYAYSNGADSLGAENFLAVKSLMTGVVAAGACLLARGREGAAATRDGKALALAAAATATDSLGYFAQLISAAHLPAVVLYPVVTGGTVVLTAIAGRIFFHETHDRAALTGFAMSFIATVLFALP